MKYYRYDAERLINQSVDCELIHCELPWGGSDLCPAPRCRGSSCTRTGRRPITRGQYLTRPPPGPTVTDKENRFTIIKQGSFIVDTCIVLTSSKKGPDSSIHRHSFIVNNVYFLTVIDIIYYNINVMHYLEWNKALHPLYDSCRCGPEMRST